MGKETHSRRFGKNSVIPAKAGGRPAGIHRESARATSLWIPAFAGMTEGCANAGLMSLPTKYSDEPKIEVGLRILQARHLVSLHARLIPAGRPSAFAGTTRSFGELDKNRGRHSDLNGHAYTMEENKPAAPSKRRLHSDEFKAAAINACLQPAVSIAVISQRCRRRRDLSLWAY